MRMTSVLLASLALGAGVSMGPGRAPSVDMVSARFSDAVPAPAHLGHWDTPSSGRAALISVQILEPGTGDGSVTFEVMHEGVGTLCAASVPCTAGALLFAQADCAANDIPAGARVHLAWSHTCTTPPHGNTVFGFEWAR